MTTRLALPGRRYSDVLGTLRQRKAAGQTISSKQQRAAWESYWDTMAARQSDVRRIGIQEDQLALNKKTEADQLAIQQEQLAFQERAQQEQLALAQANAEAARQAQAQQYALQQAQLEMNRRASEAAIAYNQSRLSLAQQQSELQRQQAQDAAKAAKIKGITSLGETAALSAYALKGTSLGAKLGLGGPVSRGAFEMGTETTAGLSAGQLASQGAAESIGLETGGMSAFGTIGSYAGTAGIGYLAGMIPIGSGGKTGAVKGAVAGAAAGSYLFPGVGTVVGGVLGAVGGLFGGGGCIIVTAATHRNSYEVQIARMYRDKYLTPEMLRGYYMVAEKVVPLMEKYGWVKRFVKKHLVDHLIRYGEYVFGINTKAPLRSVIITKAFLKMCKLKGAKTPVFIRANGEVF